MIDDLAPLRHSLVETGRSCVHPDHRDTVTAIRDMTQTVTDQFSGMVQAVEDHTQSMSDAAKWGRAMPYASDQ